MAETIKVGMVSLGCPKNQCDAELMLAKIAKAGFKIVTKQVLRMLLLSTPAALYKVQRKKPSRR